MFYSVRDRGGDSRMQNHFPALREPPVDGVRVTWLVQRESVCVWGISHGPALLPVGSECNPAVKDSFFWVCMLPYHSLASLSGAQKTNGHLHHWAALKIPRGLQREPCGGTFKGD